MVAQLNMQCTIIYCRYTSHGSVIHTPSITEGKAIQNERVKISNPQKDNIISLTQSTSSTIAVTKIC